MTHIYSTTVSWEGSTGLGYRGYSRSHTAVAPPAEATLALSADPAFRGDGTQLNPEQLLVAAASSCQLLSFLAVAAQHGVDVIEYQDNAEGVMGDEDTPMRISRVVLRPVITVTPGTDPDEVQQLVHLAHEGCYIANSLNTAVELEATVQV